MTCSVFNYVTISHIIHYCAYSKPCSVRTTPAHIIRKTLKDKMQPTTETPRQPTSTNYQQSNHLTDSWLDNWSTDGDGILQGWEVCRFRGNHFPLLNLASRVQRSRVQWLSQSIFRMFGSLPPPFNSTLQQASVSIWGTNLETHSFSNLWWDQVIPTKTNNNIQ